jgi:hypothetical protein
MTHPLRTRTLGWTTGQDIGKGYADVLQGTWTGRFQYRHEKSNAVRVLENVVTIGQDRSTTGGRMDVLLSPMPAIRVKRQIKIRVEAEKRLGIVRTQSC